MKSFLKTSWPFLLLAVLSFTLHFAFLNYPSQVVFDEVHFGKFVAAYFTGQYYFDIHPPLGKLVIAGWTKLAGIDPVFAFDKIGENIPGNTLFILRFLPAFFGSIFILVFSWLAYLISRSPASPSLGGRTTALIAGFLILFDNAFLVQSKFILVDIFMLCFEILTLVFFFLYQRQKSFSARWFGYLTLTGIFAGLTISVKWTGLAVIGIMGVILYIKLFSEKLALYLSSPTVSHSERNKESPADAGRHKVKDSSAYGLGMTKWGLLKEEVIGFLAILLIVFIVYALPFSLHFRLLPNSGAGDAFMSQPFQQELKYGRDNVYQPLTFWQKFTELNKTMFSANAGLKATHPFDSKWYSWPLNNRPVYYWNQDSFASRPGWLAKIYFSGNPALWYLSLASIVFIIIKIITKKGRRQLEPIFYLLLIAYLANLLPFIPIKRVSFLYHYLPSAMYAILLLSLVMAQFWLKQKKFFFAVLFFIIFSFIVFSPLSYGWPIPSQINQTEIKIINLFN